MGYLSDLAPFVKRSLDDEVEREHFRTDPVAWGKVMFGDSYHDGQVEVMDDVAGGSLKDIVVKAGHGTGKSRLASVLVCWWIDVHPVWDVFVATTAPSFRQVRVVLWREIRNLWALSQRRYKEYRQRKASGQDTTGLPDHALPGYITSDAQWKDDLGNIIAMGASPALGKETDSFQGIHARRVLAVGDEAGGLSEPMFAALNYITTGSQCRRLMIGNPSNGSSRFAAAFNDKTGVWSTHEMSVLSNPTFHGGGKCDCHPNEPYGLGFPQAMLESLSGPSFVDGIIAEYGKDSPIYKIRVLGEFSFDSGMLLFDEMTIAQGENARVFVDPDSKRVLGVDVAWSENGDSTFIYLLETGFCYTLDEQTGEPLTVSDKPGVRIRKVDEFKGVPFIDMRGPDGNERPGQATLIHQHAVNLNVSEVRIDAAGVGHGLVENMIVKSGYHAKYLVLKVLGGDAAPDSKKWFNQRAFQLDQMRRRMMDGTIDIDPDDALLTKQMGDVTYDVVDPHHAIRIESKKDMRKRGVKSPDALDAAWYACADLTETLAALTGPEKGSYLAEDPWSIVPERFVRNGAGWPM